MKKKGVVVLGATGSIGLSTAKVLEQFPDRFEVISLVARNNLDELARQAGLFKPRTVITTDERLTETLQSKLPAGVKGEGGWEPVMQAVTAPETDVVVCAIVGTGGLEPVVAAIRAGKTIALASKEVMVMAGEIVRRELAASPTAKLVPVDSEHSAIFQCLAGRPECEVKNLLITASGGAFRSWSMEEIAEATLQDALKHPNWSMGPKVTIDSASLMNKALEMVEARYIFDVVPEKIKVVLHPQSIVHSMVELCDNSVIAQLCRTDMRFAIQYALTYPERFDGALPAMDFETLLKLEFSAPDRQKYPSIGFAEEAMRRGGTMPAVMNAANEVAVERFRREEIRFTQIWSIVEKTMAAHDPHPQESFAVIKEADAWARGFAAQCN